MFFEKAMRLNNSRSQKNFLSYFEMAAHRTFLNHRPICIRALYFDMVIPFAVICYFSVDYSTEGIAPQT